MFYDTDKNNHGLPYNPFKSIVVPRPIGWVTTLDSAGGINLAPFSQFNNLAYDPPYVMFAASNKPGGQPKDSVVNAMQTGEFVCSMATYALREAVNITAQFVESDVDEMALAGLTPTPSRLVAPPGVAESPVHLECRFYSSMVLPGHTIDTTSHVVVGRVLGVHIEDNALNEDGRLDIARLKPLARLGYHDYTAVESIFTMAPTGPDAEQFSRGLMGEARGAAE